MNTKHLIFTFTLILTLLTTCTSAPLPATATPAGRPIIFGDISDDPVEVIEGTQPLADYLASHLGDFGITAGQVRVVASADEMATLLTNGEVDVYCDSVYPATLISDQTGAEIILRRWRFGVEEYNSVIFTTKDSGITNLDDLPGHIIALDNAFSTSGYLLPAVTLLKKNLTLVSKATYEDTITADEVGFVFSFDDENTLQWVLNGLVSAGATDDYHYNVTFPDAAQEKLVLLAETEKVPRQVVVTRPNMDADLLNAIKHTLTTAHETEAGLAALDPFQTTRFDEFPEGIKAAQNRMRTMIDLVKDLVLK